MKSTAIMVALVLAGCGSSGGAGGSGGDGGTGGGGGGIEPDGRIVFVTSSLQTASLGGLAGADAICAAEASSAGLDGEFKAWLSTLEMPAADRLTRASVPYVLVDGTRIADDWADLVDGDVLAPIDLDASGQARTGDVWTGTLPDGQSFTNGDCMGFASEASDILSLCGSTAFTDGRWSEAQTPSCNTRLRLYCFQQ